MGRVRAVEERDIPWVVDLHRRVLLRGTPTDRVDMHHAYFKEMFLDAPWSDGQPSLVYEDGDGEPIGFLGIMTRRMMLYDRPIRAVVTAHFVVEPARRTTLAGIELLRAVMTGPQDLTIADTANDISRKLYEGLGAITAMLYSLYWVRLLRPAEFSVARWSRGHRGARVWIPLSRVADAVVAPSLDSPRRPRVPATSGEDLDGDTLAKCIAEFTRNRALRAEYDGRAATWLLEILARQPGGGPLRKVLVRTSSGEIAGWYLYCGNSGGVGEVLQVGAQEGQIDLVLDHLFAQARDEGLVAVMGKIDPPLVDAFSARHCFFHHRGGWMLAHARDPEVLQAIQRGDAFLTYLESEWSMRF
jgi:hypothetical protein